MQPLYSQESLLTRKARGAFFTPQAVARYVASWAVRSSADRVMEPSAGEAEFLVAATRRLLELQSDRQGPPLLHGVEIHPESVRRGSIRVREAGGVPKIRESDFFLLEPENTFDAVIGNPPYIRYQDFSGELRARSRLSALRAGVPLSGLASSWAAFTIQSSMFLKMGGRLGLVLPAELLSVNYAAPVRQFLFDRFRSVELVLFSEQVFPDAEADVVLLLADGYGEGPTDHAIFRQVENSSSLENDVSVGIPWTPLTPSSKWTGSLMAVEAQETLQSLREGGDFCTLQGWGETTLGIVTGNNKFFSMSPGRSKELGFRTRETLPLSPPGSAHLRGLSLTTRQLKKLGDEGKSTRLFRPHLNHSDAAEAYIQAGIRVGVDQAYKCRVRKVWYQAPIIPPADLLLTYMNADTARLCANEAKAYHLNSVHGVYLHDSLREIGKKLLPIASLNSVTLLHAELVGRSYGGGVLKLEPREADRWLVPSLQLVQMRAAELSSIRPRVSRLLRLGDLLGAVALVDQILFDESDSICEFRLNEVRKARSMLADRRRLRGASRGKG